MSEPGAGPGAGTPRPALHLAAALVAALLSLLPLVGAGGLLDGPPGVPLRAASDEVWQYGWVQTLRETGGVQANPRLGLPGEQVLADFPQAALSPVQVGLVWVLGAGSPGPEAVNLYLALTFPLVALSAYLAGVLGGLRPRWALVLAVLFSTTPYHFGRGAAHLLHSGYFGIPWLALACGWLLRGAPEGPAGHRGGLAAAAMGPLLGGVEPYYTAFALLLLPACAALGSVRGGRRPLVRGLALVASTLLVVGLAWWPIHRELAGRGANPAPLARAHAESELYGLKLTSLLVPAEDHRSPAMRRLARRYAGAPLTNENRLNSAGVLGSLGILGLLASLLVGGHGDAGQRARARLLVLVLLLGTVGGLGSALALAGLEVVRAWNRLAILATWLGLVGLLHALQARVPGAAPARALAAGVLLFGLWDQVPADPLTRAEGVADLWAREGEAWRALERSRPDLRRLLVVPHRAHPAATPARYTDWLAQQRPSLHTAAMAFSAGAIRGRPDERWAAALANLPLGALLHRLRADGWDGLVVDREARPGPSEAWLADLEARVPGLALDAGRFRVHPLAGCGTACDPEARGVYLRPGVGVSGGPDHVDDLGLEAARGELLLLHGGDGPRRAHLRVRARALDGAAGTLWLRAPGGAALELAVGSEPAVAALEVTVPAAGLAVTLETDLPRALEDGRLPEHGRRVLLAGSEVEELRAQPEVRDL